MSKCPHCIKKEKTWEFEEPIQCAFESGVFSEANWNCGTMDYLRALGERREVWNEDMYASIIPVSHPKDVNEYGGYLYLEWYKSRGRTDKCYDMETLKPITLKRALTIINQKYANDNKN